ncbi:MAG: C-type lectin domain-containing protein, partial [Verrucomicrobiota bacterium]
MGYLPNDDGTMTVWAYSESGANYSKEDLVTSERLAFRGHYYQLVVDWAWLNWDEAVARCEAMGGNLVVINDKEENDFLTRRLGAGRLPCFLGSRLKRDSDVWEWVDGSPMTYQNWIEGQPHNAR